MKEKLRDYKQAMIKKQAATEQRLANADALREERAAAREAAAVSSAGAQQSGEGLFGGVLDGVDKSAQQRNKGRAVLHEAFSTHGRSIFTVEVGTPTGRDGKNPTQVYGGDQKVRVVLPVTVRIDNNAYSALCVDIKKLLQDSSGLNLRPVRIVQKLSTIEDGKTLAGHIDNEAVANALKNRWTGHVFCIVRNVDLAKKQASVEAYAMDEDTCKGLCGMPPSTLRKIRIDVLDAGGKIIASETVRATENLLNDGFLHRPSSVGHNVGLVNRVCAAIAPGYILGNPSGIDVRTPVKYPVVKVFHPEISLSKEIMQNAKAFKCQLEYGDDNRQDDGTSEERRLGEASRRIERSRSPGDPPPNDGEPTSRRRSR